MATDHILSLLISERDKIDAAIEALQGSPKTEKGSDRKAAPPSVERDSKPPAAAAPAKRPKRKLSAAGRRAIIEGTKKRWAEINAAKAAAAAPAPVAPAPKAAPAKTAPAKAPAPVKKGGLTEAGRKALSIAMKQRWAAKRKAAAKKKAA